MTRLEQIRGRLAEIDRAAAQGLTFRDTEDLRWLLGEVERLEANQARVLAELRALAEQHGNPAVVAGIRVAIDLLTPRSEP